MSEPALRRGGTRTEPLSAGEAVHLRTLTAFAARMIYGSGLGARITSWAAPINPQEPVGSAAISLNAHSAASKCHRVVALKQTTSRGAVAQVPIIGAVSSGRSAIRCG